MLLERKWLLRMVPHYCCRLLLLWQEAKVEAVAQEDMVLCVEDTVRVVGRQ